MSNQASHLTQITNISEISGPKFPFQSPRPRCPESSGRLAARSHVLLSLTSPHSPALQFPASPGQEGRELTMFQFKDAFINRGNCELFLSHQNCATFEPDSPVQFWQVSPYFDSNSNFGILEF